MREGPPKKKNSTQKGGPPKSINSFFTPCKEPDNENIRHLDLTLYEATNPTNDQQYPMIGNTSANEVPLKKGSKDEQSISSKNVEVPVGQGQPGASGSC